MVRVLTLIGQATGRSGGAIGAVLCAIAGVPVALLASLITFVTGEGRRLNREWESMQSRDADGFTLFQTACERRLIEATRACGCEMAERQVRATRSLAESADEYSIHWQIEGTPLRVWLHGSGAEITGPGVDDRIEKWDTRTPEELINVVCEQLVGRVAGFRGTAF
jgi:hypothetical protein